MKIMNEKTKLTYIAPEMEIMIIEVEQSILGASLEGLGETLPEKDW